MHELGRRYAPDPRDRNYRLRAVAPIVAQPPTRTYRYWYSRFNIDQTGPTCVANTWAHKLGDSPRTWTLPALDRLVTANYVSPTSGERGFRGFLYDEAQAIDEWGDTPPEGGTSVRAGAKVVQRLGLISNYWWAYSVDEVVRAVLEISPVAMGSLWYEGMFVAAGQELKTTGPVVGGHAYLLDGVNTTKRRVRVQTWGDHFWLSFDSLDSLLMDWGEAAVALEP